MNKLQDSSEIREASKLIADLLNPKPAPAAPPRLPESPIGTDRGIAPFASGDFPASVSPFLAPAPKVAEQRPVETVPLPGTKEFEPRVPAGDAKPAQQFRGDMLEHSLEAMCKRSGFIGAVVADNKGLPLAVYNSPVGTDAISAFTTVLGGALEKAGTLLGQHGAETISMDINYADKMVLRVFTIDDKPYFIMILCPQHVDVRGEIELSISQITAILTGSYA